MTGTKISKSVKDEYQQLLDQQKPGAAIKLMREEKGISLEQITRETLIPEWKLSDLENDVYEGLGATIFVMGYMRKVARILDIEADALITAFGHDPSRTQEGEPVLLDPEEQKAAKAAAVTAIGQRKKPVAINLPGPAAVAVLLLIIVVIALWMKYFGEDAQELNRMPESAETLTEPAQSDSGGSANTDEVDLKQADEVEKSDGSTDSLPVKPPSVDNNEGGIVGSADADVEPPGVSQTTLGPQTTSGIQTTANNQISGSVPTVDAARIDDADAAGSDLPDGEQLISVVFSDDCWIQITDAMGKVLIAELRRTGDNLQLFGVAPFHVMLGNARAADISYNGETVHFSPAPGRDTLRLTVGD